MGKIKDVITGGDKKKKREESARRDREAQAVQQRADAAEAARLAEEKRLSARRDRINSETPDTKPTLDAGTSNNKAIVARRGRSGLVTRRDDRTATRGGVSVTR